MKTAKILIATILLFLSLQTGIGFAAASSTFLTTTNINLRVLPTTSSKMVKMVKKGTLVSSSERKVVKGAAWRKVKAGTIAGWCMEKYLKTFTVVSTKKKAPAKKTSPNPDEQKIINIAYKNGFNYFDGFTNNGGGIFGDKNLQHGLEVNWVPAANSEMGKNGWSFNIMIYDLNNKNTVNALIESVKAVGFKDDTSLLISQVKQKKNVKTNAYSVVFNNQHRVYVTIFR